MSIKKEICSICCEKINISNRKDIKCLYCNYVACRECIVQFLLININEPNCMNCKKVWNREFLCNNFTKTFINNDKCEECVYLTDYNNNKVFLKCNLCNNINNCNGQLTCGSCRGLL